ncbi:MULTISPECIES: hypothetical protein [unclassified Burkholderia]|uniref:hypothetical protein n=1 Tax=unclassified Burkholderia TaxID=2613784 RepID=UPI002ABDFF1B|nr:MULTISPECIES: hypothetical protein [unclassified Burkholderia]
MKFRKPARNKLLAGFLFFRSCFDGGGLFRRITRAGQTQTYRRLKYRFPAICFRRPLVARMKRASTPGYPLCAPKNSLRSGEHLSAAGR